MVKCTFCKKEIPKGIGMLYAKNDGKIFHFCSKKCDKNMLKLKRKPVKQKWVTKIKKPKKNSEKKEEVVKK